MNGLMTGGSGKKINYKVLSTIGNQKTTGTYSLGTLSENYDELLILIVGATVGDYSISYSPSISGKGTISHLQGISAGYQSNGQADLYRVANAKKGDSISIYLGGRYPAFNASLVSLY